MISVEFCFRTVAATKDRNECENVFVSVGLPDFDPSKPLPNPRCPSVACQRPVLLGSQLVLDLLRGGAPIGMSASRKFEAVPASPDHQTTLRYAQDKDTVVVIGFEGLRGRGAQTYMVQHGSEDVVGRNLVAVIEGPLHTEGVCAWCDALRNRCRSRRIA